MSRFVAIPWSVAIIEFAIYSSIVSHTAFTSCILSLEIDDVSPVAATSSCVAVMMSYAAPTISPGN